MAAAVGQPLDEEDAHLVEQLPIHVAVALDHVTAAERAGVLAAIRAFARHEQEAGAIPGPDPLYLLWAAPELRVIVRRANPASPVEVEDVVRPATLRAFAAARAS